MLVEHQLVVQPVICKRFSRLWTESAGRGKHDGCLQVSNNTINSSSSIDACLGST